MIRKKTLTGIVMISSKALKNYRAGKNTKIGDWWLDSQLRTWYRDIRYFFINPYRQLKKLIGWQKNVFHKDYDFDAHGIYAIIEYKLRRVLFSLENGHVTQEEKSLKAIRMAIKLACRLKLDNYDNICYDRHDKKWGKMKAWFTPCEDKPGMLTWNSSRPNAVTDEQKTQERKELVENTITAEAKSQREAKWLYGILVKYVRSWWD